MLLAATLHSPSPAKRFVRGYGREQREMADEKRGRRGGVVRRARSANCLYDGAASARTKQCTRTASVRYKGGVGKSFDG